MITKFEMEGNKYVWLTVSCPSNPVDIETCSWLLFEQGASGLEIEDVDKSTIKIKAVFNPNSVGAEDLKDLQYKLTHIHLYEAAKSLNVEPIADQDWLSNWKKYFVPFTVGDSFVICPPWLMNQLNEKELGQRKKIIIDPGMAFGTGQHATTKFCLHAIEKWAKGARILDVGTGSGILAIAAAIVLPEVHVVAIDNDDTALANARHNIALNDLESRIQLEHGSIEEYANGQFDTLMSNLTAEAIIEFLPVYNRLLASAGILIFAGIIEERLAMLEKVLNRYPWQVVEQTIDKGWVGMVLHKANG